MKLTIEKLKEMIGFEIIDMDFVLKELMWWIREYSYSYEIDGTTLIRNDLEYDEDYDDKYVTYTIQWFVYDWKTTLDDKSNSFLSFMDEKEEEEAKCIIDFLKLQNGLERIYEKIKKDGK